MLFELIECNYEECSKLALSRPDVDINMSDEQTGSTPLTYALKKNNTTFAEMLLTDPRTDINRRDEV